MEDVDKHILKYDEFLLEFQGGINPVILNQTDNADVSLDKKKYNDMPYKELMDRLYVNTPGGFGYGPTHCIIYYTPLKGKYYGIKNIATGDISKVEVEANHRNMSDFLVHIKKNFPKWTSKIERRKRRKS